MPNEISHHKAQKHQGAQVRESDMNIELKKTTCKKKTNSDHQSFDFFISLRAQNVTRKKNPQIPATQKPQRKRREQNH